MDETYFSVITKNMTHMERINYYIKMYDQLLHDIKYGDVKCTSIDDELDKRFENLFLIKCKGIGGYDEYGRLIHKESPPPVLDHGLTGVVYELTLTITKDDVVELLCWFEKIVRSKMFAVIKYQACVELTKNGMPHIHAAIMTSKTYLNANHIKAKIKFPYRFSLSIVRDLQNWHNYLKKGELNNLDLDYCRKHNIPQYWEWSKNTADENNITSEELLTVQNENTENME